MKTYAPKGLAGGDLRALLDDLVCTPKEAAKFLHVTERSVWRWLADGSAPYAVLACLWLESPQGREVAAIDVGNELVIQRGSTRIAQEQAKQSVFQVARLLGICDSGAANDPLLTVSAAPPARRLQLWRVAPLLSNPNFNGGKLAHDKGGDQRPAQDN